MINDNSMTALSVLAGPALLTNATTVLLLGTINRYARALDRARLLAARIIDPKSTAAAAEEASLMRQLEAAQLRVLLIVRSLTFFYTAVAAFGLGTLSFLVGVILLAEGDSVRFTTFLSLAATTIGVLCLVIGSGTLIWESRLSYTILREEAESALKHVRATRTRA